MALVQYFSWLKKHYPIEYREFDKMPVGGMFYDATYNFVGKELERITGEKILLSGDGYSFHVFGRKFENPDALIRYVSKVRSNPGAKPGFMATFRTAQAFQNYLRKGGTTPDVLRVAGILFTMDNYDYSGKEISYGNLKHQKQLLVITPSGRYKYKNQVDFSDAVVEMDNLGSYRTDIHYME